MKRLVGLVLLGGFFALTISAWGQDVPALIKKLKSKSADDRREAAFELAQLGPGAKEAVKDLGVALDKETDTNARRNILQALGKIGPDSRETLPNVLKVLIKTPASPNRADAAETLSKIGKPAVPALAKWMLDSADADVRNQCLAAIQRIGPDAGEAVPNLRKALNNPDAGVRNNVCIALGKIGPESKPAILDLMERLDQDKDGGVKLNALDALGNIGPDAARAVKPIASYLNDPNADIVRRAAEALAKMGATALPILKDAVVSKNDTLRICTFRAFARVDKISPELIPLVVAGLKDANAEIRQHTNAILLKADARLAVPAFLVLLNDPNEGLRKLAREVLSKVGKEAVPVFIEIIKTDKDEKVRQKAIEELVLYPAEAKAAIPLLKEALLKDSSEAVRKSASEALDKLGMSPVQILVELLKNTDPALRRYGMATLAELAEKAAPAQKEIGEALKNDKDAGVRRNAVYALKGIGKKALAELAPAVKDPDPGVKAAAIEALVEIGRDDRNTVPLLIIALKDADPLVRTKAAEGLAEVGPPAKEAVPLLAVTIRDKDPNVRKASGAALGKIGSASAPALGEALLNKDKEVRYVAITALHELGPKALQVLPAVITAMDEKEEKYEKVRQIAPLIVKEIRRDFRDPNPGLSKEVVPALAKALRDTDQDVRTNASLAIVEFAKDDAIKLAIPALGEAIKDVGARTTAADTLAKIGVPAVDVLARGLIHKDPDTRRIAAKCLGDIGPPAKAAIPALEAATEDKDADVRDEAKQALNKIKR